MRVGVFLGSNVPNAGGTFSFEDNIFNALLEVNSRHEFYVFYYGKREVCPREAVHLISLSSPLTKLKRAIGIRTFLRIFKAIKKVSMGLEYEEGSSLQNAVAKHDIEFMWFLGHAFEEVKIPFAVTVLDLAHRVTPFFPEVSVTGNLWGARENHFSSIIPRAAYSISSTKAGKHEIVKFYQVQDERVRVIPFPVPSFVYQKKDTEINLANRFGIPSPYLFYPAQFWPHKNHIGILYALKILQDNYKLDFCLVFCGSDKGNAKYVEKKARDLGLEHKVHFLGFVSTDEMIALYKNAFAMIFASFFGPDNLPPLEAFALGCPVVASEVAGANEQMGDAAILFDPKNERAMALAIKQLVDDPELRGDLVSRGLAAASWTAEDYIKCIVDMV